jgi:hypothetical protein
LLRTTPWLIFEPSGSQRLSGLKDIEPDLPLATSVAFSVDVDVVVDKHVFAWVGATVLLNVNHSFETSFFILIWVTAFNIIVFIPILILIILILVLVFLIFFFFMMLLNQAFLSQHFLVLKTLRYYLHVYRRLISISWLLLVVVYLWLLEQQQRVVSHGLL